MPKKAIEKETQEAPSKKGKAEGKKAPAKKAASKKPTKTQTENEAVKAEIIAVLTNADPMTVTDMMKQNKVLGELSNQKISALLRQMVEANVVVKATDKKKSVFSLA